MSDILKMMEQDFEDNLASSVDKLDQGGLKTVAELAKEIQNEEEYISCLEDDLKKAKKKLLKMTDEDLPALLQEVGINKFELDDGSTVEVKQTYGASILVDNRPQAYEWLRESICCQRRLCRKPKNGNPSADITCIRKRACGSRGRVSHGAIWRMGWSTSSH